MSIIIGNTKYRSIVPPMTSVNSPSPYKIISSVAPTGDAYCAFDGKQDTYYRTSILVKPPCTFAIDLGADNEQIVTAYTIADSYYDMSMTMRNWTFEGSNDGSTYDVLHTVTDMVWDSTKIYSYQFYNTTPYRYYRFNCSVKNGDNSICISEIQLLSQEDTYLEFSKCIESNVPDNRTDGTDSVYFTEQGNIYMTKSDGSLLKMCDKPTISTESNNALIQNNNGLFVDKINVSPDSDNALVANPNGFYVEDKTNDIQNLSDKFNTIIKYKKYVNTDMDYIFLTISSNHTNESLVVGKIIPFDTVKEVNGIEYNLTDYSVTLKKGKTYKIDCDIYINGELLIYGMYDITNNLLLRTGIKSTKDSLDCTSTSATSCIYTPSQDCIIKIKVNKSTSQLATSVTESSYFIVQEINQKLVIDPLEHVNEESGIEDTPVGHIIQYMGIEPPKHYLICDGFEYNISDYPYLAQHFKDEFGKVNCFGGDGINTFSVPNKCVDYKNRTPIMTSNTTPSPYVVSASSAYDGYPAYYAFNPSGYWCSARRATKAYLAIDMGRELLFSKIDIVSNDYIPRNFTIEISEDGNNYFVIHTVSNNSSKSITCIFDKLYITRFIRINISSSNDSEYVGINNINLYTIEIIPCIKYEPTYFLKFEGKDSYSTEETIIGTWIDGKPIYRKVWELPSYVEVINGWTTILTDSSLLDIDTIVNTQLILPKGVIEPYIINTCGIVKVEGNLLKAYNIWGTSISTIVLDYTKITD